VFENPRMTMKMLSKIFCQCVVIIASYFGACTIINSWLQMLKLLVVAWPSGVVISLYHAVLSVVS